MSTTVPTIAAVPQVPGPDNEAVYQYLHKHLAGDDPFEVVTYAQINKLLGYDVQQKRSALDGARRRLQKEGVRIEAVIGVGVKILTNGEAASATGDDGQKIHRHAKRVWKKAAAVKIEDLPEDKRTEFLTTTTQVGVMLEFGSSKARTRIASEVGKQQQQLPITRAIEVFREPKEES